MKRPCIAPTLLLATFVLGLAQAGSRPCEAGSPGQLAFAMRVERCPSGGSMVSCPLACCWPFADELERCEAALQSEVVRDELDQLDAETAPIELAESETELELNAPEIADVADDTPSPAEYQSEYANKYGDFLDEIYARDDYDPYTCSPEHAADTTDHVAKRVCESGACHADLILREDVQDAAEEVTADDAHENAHYECPFDCYGYQVGDEYGYFGEDEDDSNEPASKGDMCDENDSAATEESDEAACEDYESYIEDYYAGEYGDYEFDYQPQSDPYEEALQEDAVSDAAGEKASADTQTNDIIDDAQAAIAREVLSLVEDDLPWADEAEFSDDATKAADATETADAPGDREYGSDYAEAYLRPVDPHGVPYPAEGEVLEISENADEIEATIEAIDLPAVKFDSASVKSLPKVLNVSRLATACGEYVASWSKSLTQVAPALQVARAQIDEATRIQ